MKRKIRPYIPFEGYRITPHGRRHYALYEGRVLVCVTVYRKGAIEVLRRLASIRGKGNSIFPEPLCQ